MRPARLVGWLFGVPALLVVVDFAVANRQPVTLELWPLPWSLAAPAFLTVLGALAAGIVVGAAVAGASGLKARRRAGIERRRAESLARQLHALQTAQAQLPAPDAPRPSGP